MRYNRVEITAWCDRVNDPTVTRVFLKQMRRGPSGRAVYGRIYLTAEMLPEFLKQIRAAVKGLKAP